MFASCSDLTDEVIKDYLVGRKVVAADETTITLDNGTKLTLEEYYNCCAGYVPRLKDYKNLIGSVVTAVSQEGDGYENGDYTITLFGDANKILGNIYVKGDPGTGWYGTCATFSVS